MFVSKSEKKILQSIYLYPILLVLITFSILLFIISNFIKELEVEEKILLKNNLLIKEKKTSLNHLSEIISYIDHQIVDINNNAKTNLKTKTHYIENIINNNSNKSNKEIKKILFDILNIKDKTNTNYFIYNQNNNSIIYNYQTITQAQTQLINLFNKTRKNKKELYLNSDFVNNNKLYEKDTYVKHIVSKNWVIVTSLSNTVSKPKITNKIIQNINSKNSNVWIYNDKFKLLSNPNNKNKAIRIEENKKITNIINIASGNKNAIFVEYPHINKKTNKTQNKMSYIYHIPQLNWIIGINVKLDNLNSLYKNEKKLMHSKIDIICKKILVFFGILLIISIYVSTLLSKKIKNEFIMYSKRLQLRNDKLEEKVLTRTKELDILNINLKEEIKKEVEKNRSSELKLLEKSKFNQISEMLENIAHQWRQPLNVISVIASGLLIKIEMNMFDKYNAIMDLESISDKTSELSSTIENFKNIVNEKDEYEFAIIGEIIENAIYILKDNFIKVQYDMSEVEIHKLYINIRELTQVLLNILNNSKDALLLNNKDDNRHINIECKLEDKFILIRISDNAGGIKNEILPKIFDPYFTTKHKSNGTGVGLYHSKKIIETNLNGSINIINTENGLETNIQIPI